MKCTVDATSLKNTVKMANKAVTPRGLLPVLSNVRLVAGDAGLVITGYDLETSITPTCPARVELPGAATVNARRLLAILALLPAGEVTLWLDEDYLTVSHGQYVLTMFSLPVTEFPEPPPAGDPVATMPGSMLTNAVAAVKHSYSADAAKSVLAGINLSSEAGVITMASTDGYRLSIKTCKPDGDVGAFSVTVPGHAMEKLVSVMDPKDTVTMHLNPAWPAPATSVCFKGLSTTVTMRAMEGKYPDYRKIVPTTFERTVTADRALIRQALALAAVFASDRSNIVKMSVDKALIKFQGETEDQGKAVTSVPAELSGECLDIAFNATFFGASLRAMTGKQARIQMGGAINPAVLVDPDDPTVTYLLMPIRP